MGDDVWVVCVCGGGCSQFLCKSTRTSNTVSSQSKFRSSGWLKALYLSKQTTSETCCTASLDHIHSILLLVQINFTGTTANHQDFPSTILPSASHAKFHWGFMGTALNHVFFRMVNCLLSKTTNAKEAKEISWLCHLVQAAEVLAELPTS